MKTTTPVIPEVGMGVTVNYFTDRYAGTITEIVAKNKFKFKEDNYVIKDHFDGYAEDDSYEANPNGREYVAIRTTKGWKVVGSDLRVSLGVRSTYVDPSF